MLITPATLRVLNTKFYSIFQHSVEDTKIFWPQIATKVESTTRVNTYGWLGQLPQFRKWVGARHVKGISERVQQIVNEPYELTVGVSRAQLEDDDIANEQLIVQGAGSRAKKLPDKLVAALVTGGESSLCFDGQYFFDTDHPTNLDDATAGTQVNYYPSGMPLTSANFDTLWTSMASRNDEQGQNLGITPNLIVVPPQLRSAAETILKLEKNQYGADNLYKGWVDILVVNELSVDPTAWLLMDTTQTVKPFIVQERKAPVIVSKTSLTDDNVFWRDEFVWGADARYGAGYGPWFLCAKARA